jgi:hypothetical protein
MLRKQSSESFGRPQTVLQIQKCMVPAFFEEQLVGKDVGLYTYKPSSEEYCDWGIFCIKRLRN